MKRFSIIAAALLLIVSASASAQTDDREPGIYAINGNETSKMTPVYALRTNKKNFLNTGKHMFTYRNATSDTKATGSFLLVCDLARKKASKTRKSYDVFTRNTTPENVIIIPLDSQKKGRTYSGNSTFIGMNTEIKGKRLFAWEQTADNAYRIDIDNLSPGEYAIVFKPTKMGQYDFNCVFDFTISDEQ